MFLHSDKTLKSKRVGITNKSPNIFLTVLLFYTYILPDLIHFFSYIYIYIYILFLATDFQYCRVW